MVSFSALEKHTHITGLDVIVKSFYLILDDVKRKPYDLLDFTQTQFDRDHLEFNVNIHDMEAQLQVRSLPAIARAAKSLAIPAACRCACTAAAVPCSLHM